MSKFVIFSSGLSATFNDGSSISFRTHQVGEYFQLISTEMSDIIDDRDNAKRPEYCPLLCSGTGRCKIQDPEDWAFEGEPPLASGAVKIDGTYYKATLKSPTELVVGAVQNV